MNLYVIGPVTGKENENREEFERVREELYANYENNVVVIPHNNVEHDASWESAMCVSIITMAQWWSYEIDRNINHPFGIAMLDGWEDSRGATIEHDLAEALGIECRPWREWL